jgi:hypothetical protein
MVLVVHLQMVICVDCSALFVGIPLLVITFLTVVCNQGWMVVVDQLLTVELKHPLATTLKILQKTVMMMMIVMEHLLKVIATIPLLDATLDASIVAVKKVQKPDMNLAAYLLTNSLKHPLVKMQEIVMVLMKVAM